MQTLQTQILTEIDLDDCLFWNVRGFPTKYEPKVGACPYIPSIANFPRLTDLTYQESPHGLLNLREGFKRLGYREQERKVTYSIKHTQRLKLWNDNNSNLWDKIESMFLLVFFEWPCAYGMSPIRPFLFLIALIFIFAIPYAVSLLGEGEDGIWVVWITDRVRNDLGGSQPIRLKSLGWDSIKWGLYFSVLSAFSALFPRTL